MHEDIPNHLNHLQGSISVFLGAISTLAAAMADGTHHIESEVFSNNVNVLLVIAGGGFGAYAGSIVFPTRDDNVFWQVLKFMANWIAALFISPAIITFVLAEKYQTSEGILLVSGICGVIGIGLIRYIRNQWENWRRGRDK